MPSIDAHPRKMCYPNQKPIDFYTNPIAPRCRAVAMVARHLGIQLNEIRCQPYTDTRTPEFLALNPEHTIPTIVDDGFVLWESRAIMTYLCNKYAPDSDLYPQDPLKRALVDRMLLYDLNPLCAAAVELHFEFTFANELSASRDEKSNWMRNTLRRLDKTLAESKYVAGDHVTLADISMIPSVTLLDVTVKYDFGPFPNIRDWIDRLRRELPYFDEFNYEIIEQFRETVREIQQQMEL